MKKHTLLLLASLFSLAISSQNDPRIARTKVPLADVPLVVMPHQDNEALLAAEMDRRGPGIAPKFAVALQVDVSPATHGRWEQMSNGNLLWRLRIRSEGAKSLNLGFTKYLMPDRGSLVLYTTDQQTVMGPFTPADNEEHEQFWTPILPGEEVVIEVKLPAFLKESLQLELKSVNHDFLGFAEMASGSCNLDVACGAADGWGIVDRYRDIIQSVGVYTLNGIWNCTGFLVNNARQDCTPFFMTADHCGVTTNNDQTVVTYWNFENSTCRQPNSPASGGNGNGSLADFNTGSVFRAGSGNSDFTLLEFDDPVSATADAFYAGWSAEDFAPTDTVIAIHHPSTDEKRISFEFQPTFVADYNSTTPNANGTHLTVLDWDIGTTEGGSSGSPLFNREKQVVGQLHGGLAFCGNDLQDSYGWFHRSWTGGGSASNSLKPWLDPDNTGIITLDGRPALQCSYFVEGSPSSLSACAPSDLVFAVEVSSNFTADVTLSVANLPAGLTANFGQNPLPPGGATTLTLSGTANLAEGNYDFILEGTDGTASNLSNLQFFVAPQSPVPPTLISPTNGASGIGLTPNYTWSTTPNTTYDIEISTDAGFTNIIETAASLTVGAFTGVTPLAPQITYFWRVRGRNICGEGAWPNAGITFTTGAVTCATNQSTDVPVEISDNGALSVISILNITTPGFVDDINIRDIGVDHTWVGDLRAELTSPSGTTITVFTNPGSGACSQDDILVSFDDEAETPHAQFLSACDNTPPAIEGLFQPFEALSAFNGEPAAGAWILTIYDDANEDGGNLISWGIDICTTIPNDLSVVPNNLNPSNCLGGESSFTLQLGTAFDGSAGGVGLTANGLPQGATATFSPNPAAPGAQVSAVLSGATTTGAFNIEIVATDALSNSGTTTLQWEVNGAPQTPAPLSPQPNATGVPISPVISWSNVTNDYRLQVATDPAMANVVYTGNTPQPSLVVIGLQPCTDYYWTVTSLSDCGNSQSSAPQLFTTVDDLTFNVQQSAVSSCPTGNLTLNLAVGQCFGAGGLTLSASGLPTGATIGFNPNPVMPGGSYILNMSLTNVAAGSYTITLTGTDGVNNVTETFALNVSPLAPAPVLVAPANAATDVNEKPTLDWNTVAGATSYFLEVATDANFNNVVFFTTTVQTQFAFVNPLNVNTTYYWHVIASNNCGTGTIPAAFSFTTWPVNSTIELNGLTVSVQPNPTSGMVNAIFSKTTEEKMDATLHSVNGILVKKQPVPIGSKSANFDLSALPTGVYLLRLCSESGVLTKKILLEK
ncbi:MAG: proprotein convertase P-domain-containing protein [Saprospiraceae bacterium]|nr:proprotein convertase P-domain-containing protein [Saprospiraceae bacterium]